MFGKEMSVSTARRVGGAAALGAALAVIFHWAFNASIPALLQVPEATFKQSLGLILLTVIVSLLTRPRWRQSLWHGGESRPRHD